MQNVYGILVMVHFYREYCRSIHDLIHTKHVPKCPRIYTSYIAEAAVKAGHKAYFAYATTVPASDIEWAKTMGVEIIFFKSDVEIIFESDSLAKMLTEADGNKQKPLFIWDHVSFSGPFK